MDQGSTTLPLPYILDEWTEILYVGGTVDVVNYLRGRAYLD